jgi:hypothetical protein
MPERDRLARTLPLPFPLRSPEGRAALEDLIALYRGDSRVAYQPVLRPVLGCCPVPSCEQGVDSWRWCRVDRKGFSYHGEPKDKWGCCCDRVDLGTVSRCLVREGRGVKMNGAEIWESVEERGGSDHVPIGVVLQLDEGL